MEFKINDDWIDFEKLSVEQLVQLEKLFLEFHMRAKEMRLNKEQTRKGETQ